MSVAAKVAINKQKHPERYCPVKGCLWHTGGDYCPRHIRYKPVNVSIGENTININPERESDAESK